MIKAVFHKAELQCIGIARLPSSQDVLMVYFWHHQNSKSSQSQHLQQVMGGDLIFEGVGISLEVQSLDRRDPALAIASTAWDIAVRVATCPKRFRRLMPRISRKQGSARQLGSPVG